MSVQGIGGLFFRAREPDVLSKWYSKHLGIGAKWTQSAGTTSLQPFPATSGYFPQEKQFMLNLRVVDLEALASRLESEGIVVERQPDWDGEYGKFARILDPEGNPIELWEPKHAS
jgi:glyoxylase I family protein